MPNYKLTIQYDGTRYKGWQRLGDTDGTIQGKLELSLEKMVGQAVEVIGSGRTDAGVHALGQVANVKLEKDMSAEEFSKGIHRFLPQDISITKVEKVDERFHARFHGTSKTYVYKIWNKEYPHPFMRKYSMHVAKPLDLSLMREASLFFEGEHDFTAFTNAKSKKKSSVRTIHSLQLVENDGLIEVRVTGDGFLYNMVRKIVGTLIDVGHKKIPPSQVQDVLQSKDRSQAMFMAEARGLFLDHVEFNKK